MTGQEKLFPSQAKGEIVFLLIRKHWFNYIIFFLLDFLMLIPIVLLGLFLTSNANYLDVGLVNLLILAVTVFVLFMLAAQLYGFVDYYLDVYIVTDQRIVDISQDGFFKRQISELHLHQVQDVNASVNGFWSTILHFGDVNIQTAAERENFVFKSIPQPYNIAKQILDLHEDHIEKLSKTAKIKKYQAKNYSEGNQDTGLPYAAKTELGQNEVKVVLQKNDTPKSSAISTSQAAKPAMSFEPKPSAPVSDGQNQQSLDEGELKEGKETTL